jgi:hypothetical protein
MKTKQVLHTGVAAFLAATLACGGDKKSSAATGRPVATAELPPPPTDDPAPSAAAPVAPPATGLLAPGTQINASIEMPFSSYASKPGDTVVVVVTGDVPGGDGAVAVPSGARMKLVIARIDPKGGADGGPRVELTPVSIAFTATELTLDAAPSPVPAVTRNGLAMVDRATPFTVTVRGATKTTY